MRILDWIYKLCRWSLGAVFIYAGGTKLLEPAPFAVLIEAYGIIPESLVMPTAIVLPALEVVAGGGLLFDIQGTLGMMAGLLVLFIAILAYGIRMGLDVDCGCFGSQDPEAEAFHGLRLSLYRDLAMLAAVFYLYLWRRYRAIQPIQIIWIIKKQKQLKKGRAEDACT